MLREIVIDDRAGLTVSEAWGYLVVRGLFCLHQSNLLKYVAYISVLNIFKNIFSEFKQNTLFCTYRALEDVIPQSPNSCKYAFYLLFCK